MRKQTGFSANAGHQPCSLVAGLAGVEWDCLDPVEDTATLSIAVLRSAVTSALVLTELGESVQVQNSRRKSGLQGRAS